MAERLGPISHAWRDASEILKEVQSNFPDKKEMQALDDFHSLFEILRASLPSSSEPLKLDLSADISISDYGESLLKSVDAQDRPSSEKSLAALLTFYHSELLIDVKKSNYKETKSKLESEFLKGALRLPQRFGRSLYDVFNEPRRQERTQFLEPSEVDILLRHSEQGVYQVGRITTGPIGLIESAEFRSINPVQSLPLWHCDDPGCQSLHTVDLQAHSEPSFSLCHEIEDKARDNEGPSSQWYIALSFVREIVSGINDKEFFDLPALLADCFSREERQVLLLDLLTSGAAGKLRASLAASPVAKSLAKRSKEEIASTLSEYSVCQLLNTLDDGSLIKSIDRCIHKRSIKIPVSEIRRCRMTPPRMSQDDSPAVVSMYGVRSERRHPLLFMSSLIRKKYAEQNQLSDLAWLCKANSNAPDSNGVIEYVRTHTAEAAVEELILKNRRVYGPILENLFLEHVEPADQNQLVYRILWKCGFTPPRHDFQLQRLRGQLAEFRQSIFTTPQVLGANDKDRIREKVVNVFVVFERIIEELVSFNVWLLASDHFYTTKFVYNYIKAVNSVGRILGETIESGGQVFSWSMQGGNTLGVSLLYARRAASWMQGLSSNDRSDLRRPEHEMPFFAQDSLRRFPFAHKELWADANPSDLSAFVSEFERIVSQFEASKMPQVRNGLEHYRDEDSFPNTDLLIACESRLSAALDRADSARLLPKYFWIEERRVDQYEMEEHIARDYANQRLTIRRPSLLSGLPSPRRTKPFIVPFGNLLGESNSELVYTPEQDSEYTRMWADYPKRIFKAAPESATEADGSCESEKTMRDISLRSRQE